MYMHVCTKFIDINIAFYLFFIIEIKSISLVGLLNKRKDTK